MTDTERRKRLLEIRQILSLSSTAKFGAYLQCAEVDDRMRGLLLYHGAGTGRWTAKRVQLQNLPSRNLALDADECITAIDAALAGCTDMIYEDVISAAQACIRGMIIPSDGHELICADYSAIEGRGLAWMAGEEHILDAYRKGKRLYCVAAAGVFGVPYEKIEAGRKTDPSCKRMDQTGKVLDLSGGYAGGVGAFRKMEKSQGMDLGMTDEQIEGHVKAFRADHPMTVRLWRNLEMCAFDAVANPGVVTSYRSIKFKQIGKFLMMKLPSGRFLYYFDPKIKSQLMPYTDRKTGAEVYKDCVEVWGVDSQKKRWAPYFTYGGLLVENAVQAVARDIMADAMLRLKTTGYMPILTCHDEILCEAKIGSGSIEDMVKIMIEIPEWAVGFPIAAEGWQGDRYRK